MTTASGEVLTVSAFLSRGSYGEPYEVVDADGVPIVDGGFVQVVTPTSFLHEGQIVRAVGAQHGAVGASLQVETASRSSTGINASAVRACGENTELALGWALAYKQHQLADVEGKIAGLLGQRARLRYEIGQIDPGLA